MKIAFLFSPTDWLFDLRANELKMSTPVRAKVIMAWVEENLPPLSWQIIVMQNMKVFLKHKVPPSKFTETTELHPEIFESISQCIKERYKKQIPSKF